MKLIKLTKQLPQVEYEPLPQWARDTLLIVAGGCLAFIYLIIFVHAYLPEV